MSKSLLDQQYAEDVTSLREAQRIIADLRRALDQSMHLSSFADGEFTIFLDDEHTNTLLTLFEQQRLIARQDSALELHDALSEFVSHWLDMQSTMPRMEPKKAHEQPHRLISSA